MQITRVLGVGPIWNYEGHPECNSSSSATLCLIFQDWANTVHWGSVGTSNLRLKVLPMLWLPEFETPVKVTESLIQEDRITPRKLKNPGITTLLEDWRRDNKGVKLESSLEEFATNIEELSNGHPGIVGVCCNELDKEAKKWTAANRSYSSLAYQKHASQALPNRLEQSDTFGRLFSDLEPNLSDKQRCLLRKVSRLFFPSCLKRSDLWSYFSEFQDDVARTVQLSSRWEPEWSAY